LLGADAAVFWEAGKLETAEKLLLRQLELEPSNPQPYVMLKMIYDKMGKADLAKSYGDKVSARFPGMEEMMKKRVVEVTRQAESFMAMRSYDRAVNLFREALIINPDFVPAIVDMGSISAEKGDTANAIKYFTRAIELDPSNGQAHYNLSQVYEMVGKTAEAKQEMDRAKESEARVKQNAPPPRK
jgi:tetratricopeptide (TPR) repeat protein